MSVPYIKRPKRKRRKRGVAFQVHTLIGANLCVPCVHFISQTPVFDSKRSQAIITCDNTRRKLERCPTYHKIRTKAFWELEETEK